MASYASGADYALVGNPWGGASILTVEQNRALATAPVEELLNLPFLHPDKVTLTDRSQARCSADSAAAKSWPPLPMPSRVVS